jgi:hypothetical protein
MHRFTSHRRNTYRYFANIGVPVLPVCNLFGHRPQVTVMESKYSDPWLLVDCRWCGRRARDEHELILKGNETPERRKERLAVRVDYARRDPKSFAAQYDRRAAFPNDRKLALSLEVVDRRAEVAKKGLLKTFLDHGGVKLHLGDRWSESPYHAHVDVGAFGAYASAGGMFSRTASWLGRGHKRDLALSFHGGHVWWKVWYDGESGNDDHHRCDSWRQPTVWPWSRGRRKHRGWMCLRNGNLELNPADALWGRPRPTRTVLVDDVTLPIALGQFPGDTYLIEGKLERWDWAREHGPRWARKASSTWHFDWRGKIPTDRGNWKGDDVLGSGVTLTEAEVAQPDAWPRLVVGRVTEQMLADRRRNRYVPPSDAEALS